MSISTCDNSQLERTFFSSAREIGIKLSLSIPNLVLVREYLKMCKGKELTIPVRWPRYQYIQHVEPLVYLLHGEVPYSQIYRQTQCLGRGDLRRQAQRAGP